MTRVIRDLAQLRNNLLAVVGNAGAAGMPLKQALQSATERNEPQGSDYVLAKRLCQEGYLTYFKEPNGSSRVVFSKFANGTPPEGTSEPVPTPVPYTKVRRKPHRPSAEILLTIQYGRNESLTLSFEQARQIWKHLNTMFSRV